MVVSDEKKIIKIAVRDLVAQVLRCGDLTFEFLSTTHPLDAIRIHQKIQKSRPANYQAEVAVTHQIETELFSLKISGRVDGIYLDFEPVLVEEIKTTSRSFDYLAHHPNVIHWGQLKSYAYMFAKHRNLSNIDAQLTYYQVDTGKIKSFQKCFSVDELEPFFQNLVNQYAAWVQTIVRWQRSRDDSIRQLIFPFNRYRAGQREMAVDVYRTIKNKSQLLVQAATGIGKTMAVVFPAIKSIAEGISTKIFYLTARTTGRIAAEKALDELRNKKLKIKSLTITAKDKICFNLEAACNPEECEYCRGHYDRVNDALVDVFHQDAFTRQAIEVIARCHRLCPFEFSLELARWVDCIICDYNYAFDPRVFLRRFFQEDDGDFTFLIDEAHNLVDRSREMFSADLYKQPLLDVRRAIRRELPQIAKILGKINYWMVKARKLCDESSAARHDRKPPDDLLPLLHRFLSITERWLVRNIKSAFRQELLDLYFEISGFMRVAENFDESYVTCFEKIKKDFKLKLFCIDPSHQLKRALDRCHAAVFFSATMTPMTYFHQIFGCHESAMRLNIPSPFPAENLRIFISDNISTLFRQRESTKHQVSRAISTFIHQKKGNYLIFFPSYVYMQLVYEAFKSDCPHIENIVQTPTMSESERDTFLQHFNRENPKSIVGFAVLGGIFGEGIDLVGERLSGAVVVGVGLPGISLERELIREYFNATLQAGFEFAYQYPGINRVLQAAGRVIRSENDRGAILLIDRRYATYRYRALLLEQWETINVRNHQQFAEKLQKFWHI